LRGRITLLQLLRYRPARLVADIGRRPQILVGKAVSRARLAERRNLQRKFGAADARPRDRIDPDHIGALFHRARFQASDFGLGPPWFALGGLKESAAATC